jgi:hypothetical protein
MNMNIIERMRQYTFLKEEQDPSVKFENLKITLGEIEFKSVFVSY